MRVGELLGTELAGIPALRRPRDGSRGARVATTGRFSVATGGRVAPLPPAPGVRLAGVARAGIEPRRGSIPLPSN